jgi:hypothetical protein
VTPLETPGGVKAIVVPTSETTTYVAEVRRPVGLDSFLCDRGVLLYTVDAKRPTLQRPIELEPAVPNRGFELGCGDQAHAPFDVGPGEVSTFEDAAIKLELLAANADGSYRVRVTRK